MKVKAAGGARRHYPPTLRVFAWCCLAERAAISHAYPRLAAWQRERGHLVATTSHPRAAFLRAVDLRADFVSQKMKRFFGCKNTEPK